MYLVTGAAGFIGSSFVRLLRSNQLSCVILDALTYAGHFENIEDIVDEKNVFFVKGNISDQKLTSEILNKYQVTGIFNFAAESHVDNSISGPLVFAETNVIGTLNLLESARHYYTKLEGSAKSKFRFLHVSTDEVFGELHDQNTFFREDTPYAPNSPYSASKASSDFFVRAWCKTYGLPTLVTNCSNNYGPRHFPEKLIPLMIQNALSEKPLPVYGTGTNIRDWIHVEDHCQGVLLAFQKGKIGESYCFGGRAEMQNIQVVNLICEELDRLKPRNNKSSYKELIAFVKDRPGHDLRYAIDDSKSVKELGFTRKYSDFQIGLKQTIQWYLDNQAWVNKVTMKK